MNSLKLNLIGLIVLTSTLITNAQQNTLSLNLDEIVSLAIEANKDVRIAELDIQKSEVNKEETKSKLLPQVELYSQFSYKYAIPKIIVPGAIFGQPGSIPLEFGTKYDWSTGIKFSQLLYNQSYFTSIKIQEELIAANKLNLIQKQEELAHQVSKLYYLCTNIKQQLQVMDTALLSMQKLADIIQLRSDNGMARPVDKERVVSDINAFKIEKIKMNALYDRQINLLKVLTGINLNQTLVLTDTQNQSTSTNFLTENNSAQRTQIQLLDKQLEIKQLQHKALKQSYYPSLAAFGQHFYQAQRNEIDFFKSDEDIFYKSGIIGLNLSIPLFDGFEKKNKISKTNIEIEQLRLKREHIEQFFTSEYTDALNNYQNMLQTLTIQKENMAFAKNLYEANMLGYKQQVISLTDLIISENQLAKSHMSYNDALLKLNLSRLEIERIQGNIIKQNQQ